MYTLTSSGIANWNSSVLAMCTLVISITLLMLIVRLILTVIYFSRQLCTPEKAFYCEYHPQEMANVALDVLPTSCFGRTKQISLLLLYICFLFFCRQRVIAALKRDTPVDTYNGTYSSFMQPEFDIICCVESADQSLPII